MGRTTRSRRVSAPALVRKYQQRHGLLHHTQSLGVELYREGAIRGVEIGSVMFAYIDPETKEWNYPALELLRLTIPRRVYTQSHFDYVVDTLAKIKSRASDLKGYKFTYAPELLRHFTARFEPL